MANDGIEVPIDGNPTGFKRAMQEMLQSSKDTAKGVESAFSPLQNVFTGVQGKIAAIGAVLAGGAMFQAGIEETKKLTAESNALARQMGITATQASILNVALGDSYTTAEDYGTASQMLTRQIRTNEDAVNAMGLKTRDANGHFRNMQDVMRDAGTVLEKYKEGMDRTAVAQTLFGRGAGDGAAIIRASKADMAAAEEKARSLGLVIGVENVEALKQYKAAMNDAEDVMSSFKKAIGDAAMPALTKLAEWFADIGPSAFEVMRATMATFGEAIKGVATVVKALWSVVSEVFGAIGDAIKKAFDDDTLSGMTLFINITKVVRIAIAGLASGFEQMVEGIRASSLVLHDVLMLRWGKINGVLEESANRLAKIRAEFVKTIEDIAMGPTSTPTAKVKDGGLNYEPPEDDIPEHVTKDESRMRYFEAALDEEKRLAYERDALRGYTKTQELAFWRKMLDHADMGSNDRLAIEHKASALIVEIKKAEAKQRQELDGEGIRSTETFAMGRVEAERAAAQTALDLNQISKAEFLALEEDFEQKRYDIQNSAMVERMRLMERDPNLNVVEYTRLLHEMLEAEQHHNTKRMQIQGQAAVESQQIWKSLGDRIGNLWDQGTQAMLNGTLTWSNSMRAIGASIVAWFATDVVGKKVKTWLLGEAAQTGATQTGTATRLAIESWAAIKSIGIMAATAIKRIMNAAYETFAGIFSFLAPTMGPWAAVPAAVGMGAVAAVAGSVMSARGGYDIPRGINPMTQLHEEEMVLPKEDANVIRSLRGSSTESDGTSVRGGDQFHFTIYSPDTGGMRQLLLNNKAALVAALRSAAREFHRV